MTVNELVAMLLSVRPEDRGRLVYRRDGKLIVPVESVSVGLETASVSISNLQDKYYMVERVVLNIK